LAAKVVSVPLAQALAAPRVKKVKRITNRKRTEETENRFFVIPKNFT
jgi:hypothetical protein